MVLRTIKPLMGILLIVMTCSILKSQSYSKPAPFLAWNPYQSVLALGNADETVDIVDLATGQVINIFTSIQHRDHGAKPVWNPDGTRIAFSNDFDVEVWEFPWDKSRNHLMSRYQYYDGGDPSQPDGSTPYTNAWSEDGQKIASVVGQMIDIWDVETGERLYRFPGNDGVITAIHWYSDYQIISSGSFGDVILWNIETGKPDQFFMVTETTEVLHPGALSIASSPDHHKIALGAEDNTIRIWDVVASITPVRSSEYDSSTLKIPSLAEMDEVPMLLVAWSPDGRYIAGGQTTGYIRIFDVPTGFLQDSIVVENTSISSLEWSPYGAQLAFGSVSGEMPNTSRNMAVRSLAGDTVKVIVPYASLEQLQTISGQCLADAPASFSENNFLKTESVSKLTIADLSSFVNQVKTLPDDAIPPACAADLIAVADALIAQ